MSLYKKHRPKTFKQVIGMKDVVSTLQKIPESEDSNRFLLFIGPSGTGKTTLARILAGEIGATELSLKELNTADHNGIDSVRSIIQQSQTPSIDGAPLVWLIDEAHRITPAAQEAFLKITEDMPNNVWFIFCTTEPKKLIRALLTRPITIKTRNLTDKELSKLVEKVAAREDVIIEIALPLILKHSNGSPRQALNHLEAFKKSGDLKSINEVSEDPEELINLARAIHKCEKWSTIANMLKDLQKNYEAETVRRAVAGYIKAVLLNNGNDRLAHILEVFSYPVYETGWNGLVVYCYVTVKKGE